MVRTAPRASDGRAEAVAGDLASQPANPEALRLRPPAREMSPSVSLEVGAFKRHRPLTKLAFPYDG